MRRSAHPKRRLPRWLTSPLVVLLLVGALAACGAQTTAKTQSTPTSTPTPTPTPPPAKGWSVVASPSVAPEGRLSAISARAANDAWAVGQFEGTDGRQQTLITRWDGTQWAQVASPSPGTRDNALVAVAADSASDAWAVGSQIGGGSQYAQPLALHWNGAKWSATAIPAQGTGTTMLSGVAALSPSDAWAVGEVGTPGSDTQSASQQPLILHWNGSAWSAVPSPAQPCCFASLNAVAALAANNVWAVGATAAQDGSGISLIEHWNGSKWSVVAAPSASAYGSHALTGIAAISASDIWAVGDGPLDLLRSCGAAAGADALHWNGSKWSNVALATPPGPNGDTFSLASVTAAASNNVWAVGSAGTGATPLVEHWNGSKWAVVASAKLTTTHGLEGVAALPSGAVWAVGQTQLSNGSGPTIIEQWDGRQWAQVSSPSPGTVANELHGVTALAADNAWAVGSSAAGALAEHWDGATWSVSPGPSFAGPTELNGVAGSSANDVWAVGSQAGDSKIAGLIQHWDGGAWQSVPTPASSSYDATLNGVAALAANNAWAVGNNNTIQHWNGSQWSLAPAAKLTGDHAYGGDLLGISARAANDIWAVGGNTPHSCGGAAPVLIEHWNGSAWSLVPNNAQGVLYSVSADAANDAWAVGDQLVLHWNGKSWTQVALPKGGVLSGALRCVVARAPNDVWVGGISFGTHQQVLGHWDGTAWSAAQITSSGLGVNTLLGLAAAPAGQLWAVGYYNQLGYGEARQALIERYVP